MKKILIVASTFPRWENDKVPSFIYEYANSLKNDYQIFVLAPHSKGSKYQEIMDGIQVQRFAYCFPSLEILGYDNSLYGTINKNPLIAIFLLPLYVIFGSINIIFELIRKKIDILHIHWLFPFGFSGIFAKKILKTKFVITSHGGDVFISEKVILNKLICKIARVIIDHTDKYIVVSSAIKAKAVDLFGEKVASKIEVISMGLDYKKFSKKRNFSLSDPIRIIFVGRLHRAKGLGVLIDAIKILEDKLNLICDVYGNGPDYLFFFQKTLELNLQERIVFHGFVPHDNVPEKISNGDIFVGPSITDKSGWKEGFGLVFLEAMAMGLPVIASKSGGITDIIQHGMNGLLVPENDANSIADCILMLIQDEKMRIDLILNGKNFAKGFDWQKIAERHIKIFSSLEPKST